MLLAAVVVAGLVVSAGAANAAATTTAAPPVVVTSATVTVSDNGTQYSVMKISGVLKPGLSAPDSGMLVSPMVENQGHCHQDGSLSVQECGIIYYNWIVNSEGTGYAEMTSVKNGSTRLDSQVRLSSLKFTMAANGACYPGTCDGQPNNIRTFTISQPTSGHTYTQPNTFWSGYQRVWDVYANWCRLDQDLTWLRGSGTYHLTQTIKVDDGR